MLYMVNQRIRDSIVRALKSWRTIDDVMTYEELALDLRYTSRYRNPVRKEYEIHVFRCNCLATKKEVDDVRYEMVSGSKIPGKNPKKRYIVPYRFSQELMKQRIKDERTRQVVGQRRSVQESCRLMQVEAKVNPKYNRSEVRQIVTEVENILRAP